MVVVGNIQMLDDICESQQNSDGLDIVRETGKVKVIYKGFDPSCWTDGFSM